MSTVKNPEFEAKIKRDRHGKFADKNNPTPVPATDCGNPYEDEQPINEDFRVMDAADLAQDHRWVHVEYKNGSVYEGPMSCYQDKDGNLSLYADDIYGDEVYLLTTSKEKREFDEDFPDDYWYNGEGFENTLNENITAFRRIDDVERYHILSHRESQSDEKQRTREFLSHTSSNDVIDEAMAEHDWQTDWALSYNRFLGVERQNELLNRYPKGSEERAHIIAGTCMNATMGADPEQRERLFTMINSRDEYPAKRREIFKQCLAQNRGLDDAALDRLVSSTRSHKVKAFAVYNPRIKDATMAKCVDGIDLNGSNSVLLQPACGPRTCEALLNKYSSENDVFERRMILRSGKCSETTLRQAAANPLDAETLVDDPHASEEVHRIADQTLKEQEKNSVWARYHK